MKKAISFILSAFTLFSCTKDKNFQEPQQYLNSNSANNSVPVNSAVTQTDTTTNNLPLKKKVIKIKYPRPK